MAARLEVITGPMFAGKTEEAIKQLKRPGNKKKSILVVKPLEDDRKTREIGQMIAADKLLSTYKNLVIKSIASSDFEGFKALIATYQPQILIVEESQFLGLWLVDAIREFMNNHADEDHTVILSGLCKDFLCNPFGPIPEIILRLEPDEITIKHAVCHKCGDRPAQFTYKKGGSLNLQKETGDSNIYEARCRVCYQLPE